MFKYTITSDSEKMSMTNKVNDLDFALHLFIENYQSELFDSVVMTDTATGEVLAYFYANNPCELWQSDEITEHMLETICKGGHLDSFIDSMLQ